MQQLIPRERLLEAIRTRLDESPATALLGARQVGKTTLARMIMEEYPGAVLFDLERETGRAAMETTPELTLQEQRGLVVIDEVQRMPKLFEILRPLCDDPRCQATFLLLGSASPELVKGASETLAGRVLFLPVPGFSLPAGWRVFPRPFWNGIFPGWDSGFPQTSFSGFGR